MHALVRAARRSCAILALSALLAGSAFAQSPAHLGSWGSQGTGPGQFQGAVIVAADPTGKVLVADVDRVQVFTPEGTFVTQWYAQGFPDGMAVDGAGNVHLLSVLEDLYTSSVVLRHYSSSGVLLGSQFLSGPGCECTIHLGGPAASPAGDVRYTRWGSFQPLGPVEYVSQVCTVSQECWGVRGASPDQLDRPSALAYDPDGFVDVVDASRCRVQKFTSSGAFVGAWGSPGSGAGQFSYPLAVAVGPNHHVFVTDLVQGSVSEFTANGAFVTRWGSPGTGPEQLNDPASIAVDASGRIYVGNAGNYRVEVYGFAPTAAIRSSWGRVKSIYR